MEEYRELIERHSSYLEKVGMSPVASRVFIYLMFHFEEGATFDDILNYFNVSKSAVSNAINALLNKEIIDYKTSEGKRKRTFFIDFKKTFLELSTGAKMKQVVDMIDDVIATRKANSLYNDDLDNIALLYKMLVEELPLIVDRW